jgi:SAM-dependent methyltransferase
MFLEESMQIKEILKNLDLREGRDVIDIGSNTEEYRCLTQPYADYYVFRPLREKGVKVYHADMIGDKGVDIVADIAAPEDVWTAAGCGTYDAVICNSLLEHVTDRSLVIERLKKLTKPGGAIVLSVPYLFIHHGDEKTIDTGYRPTNIELEGLFARDEYDILFSEIIECRSWLIPIDSRARAFISRNLNKISFLFNFGFYDANRQPSKVSLISVKKK